MSNWHQEQAIKRQIKDGTYKAPFEQEGYVLVSHSPISGVSCMTFGDEKERALSSLEGHKKNQPKSGHYLYFNGKPIA